MSPVNRDSKLKKSFVKLHVNQRHTYILQSLSNLDSGAQQMTEYDWQRQDIVSIRLLLAMVNGTRCGYEENGDALYLSTTKENDTEGSNLLTETSS